MDDALIKVKLLMKVVRLYLKILNIIFELLFYRLFVIKFCL